MTQEHAGSLAEPLTEQLWLEFYRTAVARLAEGKLDYAALFAGNKFDLMITFRRIDKTRPEVAG